MDMEKLVSLCKRRGYLFQSSEIYGGLNGFWDYGPLGVELKRNVKESWWRDMVTGHDDIGTLPGAPSPYEMTGLDCSIIMHPQVWKCSGHYDLFHDFMVDCTESKKRYRHDQVKGQWVEVNTQRASNTMPELTPRPRPGFQEPMTVSDKAVFVTVMPETDDPAKEIEPRAQKFFNLRAKNLDQL